MQLRKMVRAWVMRSNMRSRAEACPSAVSGSGSLAPATKSKSTIETRSQPEDTECRPRELSQSRQKPNDFGLSPMRPYCLICERVAPRDVGIDPYQQAARGAGAKRSPRGHTPNASQESGGR